MKNYIIGGSRLKDAGKVQNIESIYLWSFGEIYCLCIKIEDNYYWPDYTDNSMKNGYFLDRGC